MSIYKGLLLVSTVVLLLYLIGVANYLTNHEPNTCDMTYMYEYPQYVRIGLGMETESRYPRYELYAYSEGYGTEKLRSMRFSGIPVLFVPGNAGSYQQARSLASVSLRKALKDRTPYHFDFFTVALNEEYSALYGGVLKEQTEFVSHCIKKILKFYDGRMRSVVIFGHSMGGILAKGVLLEPNMNVSQVSTIIMLAAPHTPAVLFDGSSAEYYQRLQRSEGLLKASGVTMVAVGGGPRDVMVTADQAMDPSAHLSVLTTGIPDVWRSTDHLCILWCKQFVLAAVRALFDSVDSTSRPAHIRFDRPERQLKAFSYHFLQRSAGKRIYSHPEKMQFERGSEWIEDIRRQYVWESTSRSNNKFPVFLMVRLVGQSDRLTVVTTNLEARDWLFACSASAIQGQSRICEEGWNLTNRTRITPDSMHRKRKAVDLDLEKMKGQGLSHIVIKISPSDLHKRVSIGVDLHSKGERRLQLYGRYGGIGKLGEIESNRGRIRYEAVLGGGVDAVSIKLKSVKCANSSHPHHATFELLEQWNSGVAQVRFITNQDMKSKTMSVQTKDKGARGSSPLGEKGAILRISLDPECAYTIEVRHVGLTERLALAVRDRWPILYGLTIALLLFALASQVDGTGIVTSIVTIGLIVGLGLWFEGCVALAILHLFAAITCCSLVFLGSTAHNIAIRFLVRAIAFSTTWSDWLLGGLHQLPLVTTTLVLSLVPATCGALVMLLSVFLYFLKLTRMYEDYLEELLLTCLRFDFLGKKKNSEKNQKDNGDREKILFHLVLFLLWCFAAVPAIPSALVWAKNFKYGARLTTEDPVLVGSWVVLAGCGILGVPWVPRTCDNLSRGLGILLNLLGWLALLAAGIGHPHYHYHLMPPLAALAVSLVSVRPLLSSIISH